MNNHGKSATVSDIPPPITNFLSVEHLSFIKRDRTILNDISFTIKPGEYVCMVGCNGAGKTTLLRQLKGLLHPSSGEIYLEGRNIHEDKKGLWIHPVLGMVFQNPENQIVSQSLEQDIAFGPENLGWSHEEIEGSIARALKITQLENLIDRETHQLSAGQQQRLALASVLAMNPRGLLLDEATSMINPPAAELFLNMIDELNDQGMTVISVTHNMEELLRAHRVILIHRGELVYDGPTDEFLRAENLPQWSLSPLPWTSLAKRLSWKDPLPLKLEQFCRQLKNQTKILGKQVIPLRERKPLARIDKLHYCYEGEITGVRNLSFHIYRGEKLILAGETGSGKTTLMQLLAGLREPDSGGIQWFRKDLSIGMALQNPDHQLFKVFAGDDVAFGPSNEGLRGRELSLRVKEAMEIMGLSYGDFKDRRISELSGGQRRKLALAGVLAMKPQVLLLDEPSAGLDPQSRRELNQLLNSLLDQGITLIIASHDLEEMTQADRILELKEGEILRLETPGDYFKTPSIKLGSPAAVKIWQYGISHGLDWPYIFRWDILERDLIEAGVS